MVVNVLMMWEKARLFVLVVSIHHFASSLLCIQELQEYKYNQFLFRSFSLCRTLGDFLQHFSVIIILLDSSRICTYNKCYYQLLYTSHNLISFLNISGIYAIFSETTTEQRVLISNLFCFYPLKLRVCNIIICMLRKIVLRAMHWCKMKRNYCLKQRHATKGIK